MVAVRRAAGLLLAALLLLLALPTPAMAHAGLVSSGPRAGEVLDEGPRTLTLEFGEPVQVVDGNQLLLPDGTAVPLTGEAQGAAVRFPVPEVAPQEGTHVLTWRVLSADGHLVSGSLPYAVGHESALVVPEPLGDERPVIRSLLAALMLLGAVLSVGVLISRGLVVGATITPWLVVIPAVLGGGAAVLRLVQLRGDAGLWPEAEVTSVVLLSLGLLGVSIAALLPAGGRAPGRLALVPAVLALVGLAWSGHTRAADHPVVAALGDLAHAGAAVVWVGGLVVLVAARRSLDPQERRVAYLRFSGRASAALVLVAGTGLLLAVEVLGSVDALVHSAHGRVLLVKVALVAVAAGLGLLHRWFLRRRGPGAGSVPAAATRLEAGVLVAVLVATGLLTESSPSPEAVGPRLVEEQVSLGGMTVRVRVAPAVVGANQVEVQVRDEEGYWVPLAAAPTATLTRGGTRVGGPMRPILQGHLLTTILPEAGEWQLAVSLRLSKFEEPVVTVGLEVAEPGAG